MQIWVPGVRAMRSASVLSLSGSSDPVPSLTAGRGGGSGSHTGCLARYRPLAGWGWETGGPAWQERGAMVVQHSLEAGQSAVRRSGGGVQRASPARFSGKPLLQACAVRPVSTPSTSRNKIFMVCFENHQKNVTPTPSTGRGCRCKTGADPPERLASRRGQPDADAPTPSDGIE